MWVYEKTKKIKQHFTDIFKYQIFVFLHIWLGLKKKVMKMYSLFSAAGYAYILMKLRMITSE